MSKKYKGDEGNLEPVGLETALSYPLCMCVKGRRRRAVELGRKTLRRCLGDVVCMMGIFIFPKRRPKRAELIMKI